MLILCQTEVTRKKIQLLYGQMQSNTSSRQIRLLPLDLYCKLFLLLFLLSLVVRDVLSSGFVTNN